jgi:Tfp pilus assembly protein PilE
MRMDNRGMTIVEGMAGFMLIVVLLASFVKIIRLSSNLTIAASDAKLNSVEFNEKYYTGKNYTVKYNKEDKLAFRDDSSNIVINEDGSIVDIYIEEWHLNADPTNGIYQEYTKNAQGVYSKNTSTTSTTWTLSNKVMRKIENIYDLSIARTCVYRYTSLSGEETVP